MIRFSKAKEKDTIQVAVCGHAPGFVVGSFNAVCGMVSVLTQAALWGCFNYGTDTHVIAAEPGRLIFVTKKTPVTEAVTGIDIVREQIRIASGAALGYTQDDISFAGHAIECRINAEDPETFIPCPGKITEWHAPGGLGIRVDSEIYSGYTIPPFYDSMIAKLIVHGKTRNAALMRLRRALEEFVIEGVKTTIPLHQEIISQAEYIDGQYNIHWLEQFMEKLKQKQSK